MLRRPRQAPLSRLKGATPTRAATAGARGSRGARPAGWHWPWGRCRGCSGARPRRGRPRGPRRSGRRGESGAGRARPGGHRCRPARATPAGAVCSATRAVRSWRRRVTKACSSYWRPRGAAAAAAGPRPRSAPAPARPVLARILRLRAKSRTWRGLLTTTGSPAAQKFVTDPSCWDASPHRCATSRVFRHTGWPPVPSGERWLPALPCISLAGNCSSRSGTTISDMGPSPTPAGRCRAQGVFRVPDAVVPSSKVSPRLTV